MIRKLHQFTRGTVKAITVLLSFFSKELINPKIQLFGGRRREMEDGHREYSY